MVNIFQLIINFLKKFFLKNEDEVIVNTNDPDIITDIDNQEDNQQENNDETKPEITDNKTKPTETNIDMDNYNGNIIILDNGHAKSTPGKCSPLFEDGTRFYEYEFSRDIVKRIANKLEELGIKYYIIVPEIEEDIALSKRANRANKICEQFGANKCMLISVHANAAGMGDKWMSARGWSVWTTRGVTKSDAIATMFYEEAEKILPKYNMTLRKDTTDGDPDYESNFTIIYKALCPAILTENLFQDNKTDVQFLMSDAGRNAIAEIHVNAIKRFCGLK